MIKFFRKIRQNLLSENKFSKYLIYAVGEIVLVVIGILIAISLNNSNQQASLKKSVDLKLSLLRQSVYQDSISMRGLIDYSKSQMVAGEKLLKLIKKPMDDQGCEEFLASFSNLINIRTNIPDRAIYDELVNSGVFSEIKEQKSKSQIATYYQLYNHFNGIINIYVKNFREFKNHLAMNGVISRAYFVPNSDFSKKQRCEYIQSMINSKEKKLMLENYIYTGNETYKQIITLYTVLSDQMIVGLPKK